MRHPRWCTSHDEKRRGQRLLRLAKELKNAQVFSPEGPTFEAVKNRDTGELRSSTVEITLSRDEILDIRRTTSYASVCSAHYPVEFSINMQVEKVPKPRRITKTLLQSNTLTEAAKRYYEVGLRDINQQLETVGLESELKTDEEIQTVYEAMERGIKLPWATQANKCRRHTPAHRNTKFIKQLKRKKLLYDRMRWNMNRANARAYKDVCKET